MNLKTTYILFGILFLVMAGLSLTLMFGLGQSGSRSDFVFPELHSKKNPVEEKDIDAVRVEHADSATPGTYVFRRDEQRNWQMEEPQHFRVAPFEVDNLVREVARASREKVDL